MKIEDGKVLLTEKELGLINHAKMASWATPEVFLKNWVEKEDKTLQESYDLAHYKKVVSLVNQNQYTIVR